MVRKVCKVNYAKIVHLLSVITEKNIFVLNVSDPIMVYNKVFDNKHNKLVNQEIAANNVLEIIVMNAINIQGVPKFAPTEYKT